MADPQLSVESVIFEVPTTKCAIVTMWWIQYNRWTAVWHLCSSGLLRSE